MTYQATFSHGHTPGKLRLRATSDTEATREVISSATKGKRPLHWISAELANGDIYRVERRDGVLVYSVTISSCGEECPSWLNRPDGRGV